MRVSTSGLKVLQAMLAAPRRVFSGADISRATGIGSGTMYPLLAKFEREGLLSSRWEEVDPSEVGRPRRRLYHLTGLGQEQASIALAGFQFVPGSFAWSG